MTTNHESFTYRSKSITITDYYQISPMHADRSLRTHNRIFILIAIDTGTTYSCTTVYEFQELFPFLGRNEQIRIFHSQLKADLHIPDTSNEETEDRESMKRCDLDNSIPGVNNHSLPPRSREDDSRKQSGKRDLSQSIQVLLKDVGLPSRLALIPSQADITIASKFESELLPTTSTEPADASSSTISKPNLPAEGDQVSRKRPMGEPIPSQESNAEKIACRPYWRVSL